MINYKDRIEKYINLVNNLEDDSLVVIDSETIEERDFFVFFYTSKKYLETNDFSYAVGGNAPIIVDKHDAKMYLTGTAFPIEFYLNKFKNNRGLDFKLIED